MTCMPPGRRSSLLSRPTRRGDAAQRRVVPTGGQRPPDGTHARPFHLPAYSGQFRASWPALPHTLHLPALSGVGQVRRACPGFPQWPQVRVPVLLIRSSPLAAHRDPSADLILLHGRAAVGALELVRGVGLKRVLAAHWAFVTLGHRHSFRLVRPLE